MAMVINTNIASLNAQRNLSSSQSSMSEAMQRLSSGLRINSAKDDAAGLAIATRFTTQINGLNQAVRNANDGISMAQTGEAALGEVTNNLQRIRELAIQSANSTNSASDRAALDSEVQQRIAEITRISGQTSFNGQKLLNGSMGTATFQIGANVGETIDVTLVQGMRSDQMGFLATTTNTVTDTALTDGNLQIALGSGTAVSIGASIVGTEAGQTAESAFSKAAAINDAGIAGLTAQTTNATADHTYVAFAAGAADDTYTLNVNGVDVMAVTDLSTGPTIDEITTAINNASGDTGVTATNDGTDISFTALEGRELSISETLYNATTASVTAGGLGIDTAVGANTPVAATTVHGGVRLIASEAITLSGTASGGSTEIGLSNMTVSVDTSAALNTQNVLDQANAELTIASVDSALTTVSDLRSEFGAIQNRFESTISNLSTIAENLSASRSRIEDADFASETAKMSRAQVLQQAGTSILAQANASTQSVLSLLQ